jgi:hypothetical protein
LLLISIDREPPSICKINLEEKFPHTAPGERFPRLKAEKIKNPYLFIIQALKERSYWKMKTNDLITKLAMVILLIAPMIAPSLVTSTFGSEKGGGIGGMLSAQNTQMQNLLTVQTNEVISASQNNEIHAITVIEGYDNQINAVLAANKTEISQEAIDQIIGILASSNNEVHTILTDAGGQIGILAQNNNEIHSILTQTNAEIEDIFLQPVVFGKESREAIYQILEDRHSEINTILKNTTDGIIEVLENSSDDIIIILGQPNNEVHSILVDAGAPQECIDQIDQILAARGDELGTILAQHNNELYSILEGHNFEIRKTLAGNTHEINNIFVDYELNSHGYALTTYLEQCNNEIHSILIDAGAMPECIGQIDLILGQQNNEIHSILIQRNTAINDLLETTSFIDAENRRDIGKILIEQNKGVHKILASSELEIHAILRQRNNEIFQILKESGIDRVSAWRIIGILAQQNHEIHGQPNNEVYSILLRETKIILECFPIRW